MSFDELPETDGEWSHSSMHRGIFTTTTHGWYSWLNGQFHNSLGPAIILDDEEKQWYVNGKRHRLDGPAIEYADGSKALFIDGKGIAEQHFSSIVIAFLLNVDHVVASIIESELQKYE